MATFKITKGAETFELDTFGPVKNQAGQGIGKWSTDKQNRIVIQKDAGGSVTIDELIWKFNSNNQLVLSTAAGEIVNFHKVGNRPFYATNDSVLVVRPDRNNVFEFSLRGEWDLSDKHEMSFTMNNVTSVLDGFIQDQTGRFMFHFFDKGSSSLERSILGFRGEWKQDENDPVKLTFEYRREKHGAIDTFVLPKAITVNRTMNQLMYEYDKKGQKVRIQFMGLVKISDDFVISYELDEQKAQNGDVMSKATTLTIKAEFDKKDFSGNAEFKIKRQGGTTSSLTFRGGFTAVYKKGVKLSVGFAFEQTTSAGVISTTFALNGKLELGSGATIQWRFEKNATKSTLTISASDIVIGEARLDGALNIVRENNQIVGVRVLFGIVL